MFSRSFARSAQSPLIRSAVGHGRSKTVYPASAFPHNILPSRDTADTKKNRNDINNNNLIVCREYHATPRNESVTLVLGLGGIALAAQVAKYGVQAYEEYKSAPKEEEVDGDGSTTADGAKGKSKRNKENIFASFSIPGFTGEGAATKFYEGPFEDEMTRREAALILGVRESASSKRIRDAHRKILILNHPDTGGSTFLSTKINEAKELLLKGKEKD